MGEDVRKKFFVFLAKRIPIPDLIFRGKKMASKYDIL
jgi:hypothetical protein